MVENEEIMGSMRGDGDNDPVSEFIGMFDIFGTLFSFYWNSIKIVHFSTFYLQFIAKLTTWQCSLEWGKKMYL